MLLGGGGGGGVGVGIGKAGGCTVAWLAEGVSMAIGAKASGSILRLREGRLCFQKQNAIKPTTSSVMRTG